MNNWQFVTIVSLLTLIFISVGGLAWNQLKPDPAAAEELQPIGIQILHALQVR